MRLRALTGPLILATAAASFGLGLAADRPHVRGDAVTLAQAVMEHRSAKTDGQGMLHISPIKFESLVAGAKKLGYESAVQHGPFDSVELLLVKEQVEPRGILKAKWSTKETVSLKYIVTPAGYYLANADSTVEQKSPVGDWQITRRVNEIPGPIWEQLVSGDKQ